jgi:hypothetical protein
MRITRTCAAFAIAFAIVCGLAASSEAVVAESKRLAQARDYMAEEQWSRAIEELRVAANDVKETRRDEALYWLAYSLTQFGDFGSALESLRQLERRFPSSRLVKNGCALRIEIASRLNRQDVLWWTAVWSPESVPPGAKPPAKGPRASAYAHGPKRVPAPARPVKTPRAVTVDVSTVPPPPAEWLSEVHYFDMDLQIQALGSLMRTDAVRVIPRLKTIALETDDPSQASRAVFIMAQSREPEALETVRLVALSGHEIAQVAAVRDLGRFGGPDASKTLLDVYERAKMPVKVQVVKSLGERSDRIMLHRIVESEKDPELRNRAIVTLGKAGDSKYLALMYPRAAALTRQMIIVGLFAARAETELINIAERERDEKLQTEVRQRLQLLGTAKAQEYLQKVSQNR